VNKIKISRVQLIESPCCVAPSTTMNPVISDARSKDRRCVRCRQVFCRIDVDQEEIMRVVGVGSRTQAGKPWKKSNLEPIQ
jgi:hypothetical protein